MEMYKTFKKPDTFNTWFLITELHIWMMMVRAMGELNDRDIIRNTIVEAMWADVQMRAEKLSPTRKTEIRKQVEILSGQFQYAVLAYDEGLMTDDKRLASALWKRFFESKCDDYELIELLIKYVRINVSFI